MGCFGDGHGGQGTRGLTFLAAQLPYPHLRAEDRAGQGGMSPGLVPAVHQGLILGERPEAHRGAALVQVLWVLDGLRL